MSDRPVEVRTETLRMPLVTLGLIAAGIALRAWYYAPFDIMHADEVMQYLEQAKRLATGSGIVPWEFRFGARNSLVSQLLAGPYWLGQTLWPGSLAGMHAVRITAVAISLLVLPAAWMLGALTSRLHAAAALGMAALWYQGAIFANLLLTEVMATGPILIAAALMLDPARSRRGLRLAGLLLGLGVALRLQYAPFVAVLAVTALRLDFKAWRHLIEGGLAAAVLCAISDLAAGRIPFQWILVNIHYNMVEGRAARFGAHGPFTYLTKLMQHLGPLAVLIIAAGVLSPARYRPLVYASLTTILFHSLIAHKEYRFIWIAVQALLILAAITSVSLIQRSAAARGMKPGLGNLAVLGLIWGLVDVIAAAHSGGARAIRGGAPIPLAALDGLNRVKACGVAMPDQWRAHLVPAMLPQELPFYVAPEEVNEAIAPLPPGIATSANVLVFPDRPRGSEAFTEVSCRQNGTVRACTYVRPGACQADPYWTYQATLERETL